MLRETVIENRRNSLLHRHATENERHMTRQRDRKNRKDAKRNAVGGHQVSLLKIAPKLHCDDSLDNASKRATRARVSLSSTKSRVVIHHYLNTTYDELTLKSHHNLLTLEISG